MQAIVGPLCDDGRRRCPCRRPEPRAEYESVRRHGCGAEPTLKVKHRPRMPSCEASQSIAAPRERVWRVFAAVVAWPERLPTVSSGEALDGEPLQMGFGYRIRQPRPRPASWVLTQLEPPRRFVRQAIPAGLLMTASHTIEAHSRDACHVRLRLGVRRSARGRHGPPVWLAHKALSGPGIGCAQAGGRSAAMNRY